MTAFPAFRKSTSFGSALGLFLVFLPAHPSWGVDALPLAAPQNSSPFWNTLDTLVVTPSRIEESWLETPYPVHVLDEITLRERSPRTLPEALKETPGVFVQKTSQGQGSPFLRGLTGYHNLLLIDGIRLNHSAFRSGPNQYWSTVDPLGLSRTELVLGPGSVLYGSDAVGGTLQAFTRRPFYAEVGFHEGDRTFTRLSSGEHSFQQRGEVTLSEAGQWGLLIGGSWKDFGDIRAADLGQLPKTGYEEWDADAKLELFLDESTRLTLFHQQAHMSGAWRTHRTVFSQSFAGTSIGTDREHIFDQDRILTYAQLDAEASTPWFDHYLLSLSHQRYGEDLHRVQSNARREVSGFAIDAYSAWAQFEKDLAWTTLAYGASYDHEVTQSYRSDLNADGSLRAIRVQGPVGDDAKYQLASAYVNGVTPLGERLEASLGARYTYAAADIGRVENPSTGRPFAIEDSWHNIVGSGRLSYAIDPAGESHLFAGISQAFRAPNLSDLSRFDLARTNEIETPAPSLEPEHFLSYELGLKQQTDQFSGSATAFWTSLDGLIVRSPTGTMIGGNAEVTKRNSGDGFIHGFELAGSWEIIPSWTLFGGFAWLNGAVAGYPTSAPVPVEEPLGKMMPMNGSAGLRWDSPGGRWWVEGLVTAFARQDALSAADAADTSRIPPDGTPGYTLATLRGGCEIRQNATVTAAVENLTGEAYRSHGSGNNEPGLNAILGLEVRF